MSEGIMGEGQVTELMGRIQAKSREKVSFRSLAQALQTFAPQVDLEDKVKMSKDWLRLLDKDELVLINKHNLKLLCLYASRVLGTEISPNYFLWDDPDSSGKAGGVTGSLIAATLQ